MRNLLALVFVLFALPAQAQPWCTPYLECKPLAVRAVTSDIGTHLYWFTRHISGGITYQGFSCANEVCDFNKFLTVSNQVLTGVKTAAAATEENITSFNCDYRTLNPVDTDHPVCNERKAVLLDGMDEWLEGIPRQVVLWRVKPNGTETTRPIRALQNGVVLETVIGRATVGAPCVWTPTFLQVGADRWMQYWNNGNLRPVVLCERVPE